jgi:hypothetical protein
VCYEQEIPKLMDVGYSMEDAFEVTALVQDLDPKFQYCHVLGHYISAKETAKDPDLWKDVVARAPLGLCSNGGVHGAFQERFRVESLANTPLDDIEIELEGICEPRAGWQPTLIGQATCVHALGHLSMYVTDGEIDDSLDLCQRLLDESGEGIQQLCYDGAFMQIYQPLEPEDFALIEGKEIETKEASQIFCSQYTGAQKGSCLSESWPLYRGAISDPTTILSICEQSTFDDWQHERCKNAVFYVAMAQANLDVAWATEFCAQLPGKDGDTCFGNSASRLIEVDSRNIDRAVELCGNAKASGHDDACFAELLHYSDYTFNYGSDEFFELCNALPSPWKERCLNQRGGQDSIF